MLSQDDHHMYVDPWILNVLFTQLIHKSLPDACMLKNAHNVTHTTNKHEQVYKKLSIFYSQVNSMRLQSNTITHEGQAVKHVCSMPTYEEEHAALQAL